MFIKNTFFISFNYTDTLEKLYFVPKESICYIHGKANNDEELVIGHNKSWEDLMELADNTPEPPTEYVTPEELEEWYSSHGDFITDQTRGVAVREYVNLQKDTLRIMSDNEQMFKSLSNVEKVYVYGFSFSYVDIHYIKELISIISPLARWEISYYSDSEKDDFSKILQSLDVHSKRVSFVKLEDLKLSNLLQYALVFDE